MKFLLLILRFIKGYVVFSCHKGFPERFINLCFKNNIKIWDIRYYGNSLKAAVSASDFKKLRLIVKRSGVKLSTEKKIGLYFTLKKHARRSALIWGSIAFVIAHFILNQFIWCIDVNNNSIIGELTLLNFAETQGLYFGKHAKSFDEETAGIKISNRFRDKIIWSGVNVNGSMAVIDIREDKRELPQTEKTEPCNIIADSDGIILSIETYSGKACVSAGSGVKKGDLLISGIVENENLGNFYYCASGKVTVLHNKEKEKLYPSKLKTQSMTEIKSYGKVRFFGITIPLGFHKLKDNEVLYSHSSLYEINGYRLPIIYEKITVIAFQDSVQDRQHSYIYSSEKFTRERYEELANSNVLSSEDKFTLYNGSYIFSGKYELIDYIGISSPLEIIEEKNF